MTFPDEKYGIIGAFADDYFDRLTGAADRVAINRLCKGQDTACRDHAEQCRIERDAVMAGERGDIE